MCSTDRTDQNENRTGDFTSKNSPKVGDTVTERRPGLPLGYWAHGGAALGFPVLPALKKKMAPQVPPCAQYRIHRKPLNFVCLFHVPWGGRGPHLRPCAHAPTFSALRGGMEMGAQPAKWASVASRLRPRPIPPPSRHTCTRWFTGVLNDHTLEVSRSARSLCSPSRTHRKVPVGSIIYICYLIDFGLYRPCKHAP